MKNSENSHYLILIISKKNLVFLVFREGPTDGIIDSIGTTEKKFSIDFSIAKTKF